MTSGGARFGHHNLPFCAGRPLRGPAPATARPTEATHGLAPPNAARRGAKRILGGAAVTARLGQPPPPEQWLNFGPFSWALAEQAKPFA